MYKREIAKRIVCTSGAFISALAFITAATAPAPAEAHHQQMLSASSTGFSKSVRMAAPLRNIETAALLSGGSRQAQPEQKACRRGGAPRLEGALSTAHA